MGDHNQESAPESAEELFEPVIGEFSEEAYEGLSTVSSEKQRLAEKRRRAEQRLGVDVRQGHCLFALVRHSLTSSQLVAQASRL